MQLREKQKVKQAYGMLEAQFLRFFKNADRAKGVSGENLLVLLERRLDNAVYRAGFASSRAQARQMVRHNLFNVNAQKVDVPSFLVKPGDVIALKESRQKHPLIIDNLEGAARRGVPTWLELDQAKFQCSVKAMPNRDEITMPIQERLIVELCSK